jgi:hypothetical protein
MPKIMWKKYSAIIIDVYAKDNMKKYSALIIDVYAKDNTKKKYSLF